MTNKNYCDCRQGRDPCTCKAVDPVPPAGVEACCEVSDEKYNRVRFYRQTGDTTKPYHAPGEKLYDQACVTRLQAEVERFKTANAEISASNVSRRDRELALQSELTKAQAEVERLKQENGERYGSMLELANGVAALKSELTKARELLMEAHPYTSGSKELFNQIEQYFAGVTYD